MRCEDILNCARHLGNGEPVRLISRGELGPPALHAAVLEPQLFSSVHLTETLDSWQRVVDTPVTRNRLVNTVHGALEFYDLSDLAKAVKSLTLNQE